MVSIATALCDGMKRTHISQKKLAQKAGVTQAYISQICAGKKTPTIATLNRLSECLDMSILDFFYGEQSEAEPLRLSEEEKGLVQLYRNLDGQERAMLMRIVSSI